VACARLAGGPSAGSWPRHCRRLPLTARGARHRQAAAHLRRPAAVRTASSLARPTPSHRAHGEPRKRARARGYHGRCREGERRVLQSAEHSGWPPSDRNSRAGFPVASFFLRTSCWDACRLQVCVSSRGGGSPGTGSQGGRDSRTARAHLFLLPSPAAHTNTPPPAAAVRLPEISREKNPPRPDRDRWPPVPGPGGARVLARACARRVRGAAWAYILEKGGDARRWAYILEKGGDARRAKLPDDGLTF